jgi:hypothetical protein
MQQLYIIIYRYGLFNHSGLFTRHFYLLAFGAFRIDCGQQQNVNTDQAVKHRKR